MNITIKHELLQWLLQIFNQPNKNVGDMEDRRSKFHGRSQRVMI